MACLLHESDFTVLFLCSVFILNPCSRCPLQYTCSFVIMLFQKCHVTYQYNLRQWGFLGVFPLTLVPTEHIFRFQFLFFPNEN